MEELTERAVAVVGATGHTGRFVTAELARRGFTPIGIGRDLGRLETLGRHGGRMQIRQASLDAPASLDRALAGTAAVINCAGPFLDTAAPVIEAALRAGVHYVDVTAEQPAALAAFDRFDAAARAAGVVLVPALGFYGGLGDLLATAAMGDWPAADEIRLAVALDSWRPTMGTRLTGARNTATRVIRSGDRLTPLPDPPPRLAWAFPEPFGVQETVALPLSEIVTLSRHLRAPEIWSYMNLRPLADLRDPATPPPTPADASGRSDQRFVLDVLARRGDAIRRATAQGRDIYAVTAPLVAEAVQRLLDGRARPGPGARAAGELFDAEDFLRALSPDHLTLEITGGPSGVAEGLPGAVSSAAR